MKPAAPIVLSAALGSLGRLAASEPDPVKKAILGGVQGVLSVLLRDWDNLAADRVGEIEALSDVLRRGAELAPEGLAGRLQEAVDQSRGVRSDLRLSVLDGLLDRMRSAVIELHAWLESGETNDEGLLRDLWSTLEVGARRRATGALQWF